MIKKLFTLFVFLSFCGSTGFGADQCYKNKYSYKDSLVQQYVDDYRALLPLYTEAINEKNTEKPEPDADDGGRGNGKSCPGRQQHG